MALWKLEIRDSKLRKRKNRNYLRKLNTFFTHVGCLNMRDETIWCLYKLMHTYGKITTSATVPHNKNATKQTNRICLKDPW